MTKDEAERWDELLALAREVLEAMEIYVELTRKESK